MYGIFRVALLACWLMIVHRPADGAPTSCTLNILHVNDFHSRFEPISKYNSPCSEKDDKAGKCYGGIARLYTKIKEKKESNPSNTTILLAAGDFGQGSLWFSVYRFAVVQHFMNLLNFDAWSPGNHEFDDGVAALAEFGKNLKAPMVAANLEVECSDKAASCKDEMKLKKLIHKSVILETACGKVGIIGYLTPDTTKLSSTGEMKFNPEVESIRKEATRLRDDECVKIIIAVGHSGIEMDKKIAREVSLVDVVIGGHTNTFLYKGTPPDKEKKAKKEGEYPITITVGGKQKAVAQAYAYGKYLGDLQVTFNIAGDVTKTDGNPILLDKNVEASSRIKKDMESWANEVAAVKAKKLGVSKSLLSNAKKDCREKECALGNLAADAMVDHYASKNVHLAVINAGAFRAPIPKGDVTMGNILMFAPFENSVDVVVLSGADIKRMFKHSMSEYQKSLANDRSGAFLQVSRDFKVVYAADGGVSVQVKEAGVFTPLKDAQTYRLAVISYIAEGGDDYDMLQGDRTEGNLDNEVFANYFKKNSPVDAKLENRIVMPALG